MRPVIYACLLAYLCVAAGQWNNRECPTVCPLIYSPVCAKFGPYLRTFGNECQLGVFNCQHGAVGKIIRTGECEKCGGWKN